ncbi:D-alanyl-D-alanine carboxypeptidase [Herbihabitans rhizosphaerae]|uniref:D-alanyl-D-alanine carboxypeptidase n=2 Tax=Herbihabitans rhizosphaerae TaxID=1872711 RepID=A0A4Q7KM93_9PSEU|nr:D-alanyl-D-alanine carboxypeptidase [Herbihabitans rhizosphaerae]
MGVAALSAALLTGLAGTAVAEPVTDGRPELRAAMDELAAAGAAGVQVRLHDARGDWVGSAGVRELGGHRPPSTKGRFRAASITKTFVATVILQLVGERRIELDAPVDGYLPEFGLDERITVRMLLQHTSGLFNYTGEINPDGSFEPGIPVSAGRELVENRFREFTPEELVGVSLSKPPRFEPGARWSYSNTNYVLAGLLIEKITGTPYAEQVEHRVLWPLGLHETRVPGKRVGIAGPHARGYFTYTEAGVRRTADITELSPTAGWAAGEMISTTRDLDRFVSALLAGKLLPPPLLEEMLRTVPSDTGGYGLGVRRVDLGCGSVFGHTGGILGYDSFMFSSRDGARRFEMSATIGVLDQTDEPALAKYVNALKTVMDAGLCGSAEKMASRPGKSD